VYGYRDLVEAQYRLVTEGLGIDRLMVKLGSSMGGMHAWLWAEQYPAMMDAIVPIACSPVAVTGRNYLWRHLIIEAIKDDPEYQEGRYMAQPRSFQRVLPLSYLFMNSVQTMEVMGRTHAEAKHTYETWVEAARKNYDANDLLYWFRPLTTTTLKRSWIKSSRTSSPSILPVICSTPSNWEPLSVPL